MLQQVQFMVHGAPFGVILITTKSGNKEGKVVVNYNNSFRFSNLIRGKHMMNSVDFASWMNDARTNTGSSVFFENDRMKQIIAIIMLPLILLVFAKQTTAHYFMPSLRNQITAYGKMDMPMELTI